MLETFFFLFSQNPSRSFLSRFEKGGADAQKTLSLEERITLKEKELKRKVIEDFIDEDWLHPIFIPKEKKVFKRISSPVAFDLEDEEETLLEALKSQLPQAR